MSILILDDEKNIRSDLAEFLEWHGYSVETADSPDKAKEIVLSKAVEVAFIDLRIDNRGFGGIEVANFVQRHQPRARIVILSTYDVNEDILLKLDTAPHAIVPKRGPNYLRAALEYLQGFKATVEGKECFVIMPFSTTPSAQKHEWTEIFEVIELAVAGRRGYRCSRSDLLAGNVIENIVANLTSAHVVIADLTDRNANVFYELGVRHALRDRTILITQNLEHVPFDLRPYKVIEYGWKSAEERERFTAKLRGAIELVERDPCAGSSPIRKFLMV